MTVGGGSDREQRAAGSDDVRRAVTGPQTVAVLFTDLVDSTQRQSELGDEAFDDVRRAHVAVLRSALEHHRGTEVKNTGDGLMVVFRSASDAIAAAVEMHTECDRHGRRHPELAMGVRIAVSIGDAAFEDGDWFGTPVVEAARLCAACRTGQLLVTDTIRLMAGSRTRQRIEPIGDLTLKGLPAPLPACEVRWEPAAVTVGVPLPAFFTTPGAPPFAGRTAERATLDRIWKDAQSGGRRVMFVAGEPGIGKTRLVAELARRVHDEGATVLVGRSDDEIDAPFRPFADALDQLVRHADEDLIDAHVAEVGPVVARLAPALSRRTAVELDDEAAPTDSDVERIRLFHAVADLLTRQAARAPVLLVLDDAHWADRSSLLLLRDLVRRLGDAAVLVVGTYRNTDLDRTLPLAATLADLRREPGVERLTLTGLTPDDVLDYLTLAGGHDLDAEGIELGHQIAEVTAGNPFFVGETLRHLAETGAIVHEDGRWVRAGLDSADAGVPEGVREVIGRRLSALDPDVERVLSVAAVAGAEFDSAVVAAVAEVPEARAVDLLDQASARSLVVEDTDRFGWYRFGHALVRQTLIEELSTTRRLRLHRALGEATEQRAPDRVEEIAHHYLEAAAAGVRDRAVDFARRAATAAKDRLAVEQASRWLRRALEAEEGLDPDPARRATMLVELGEVASWTDEALFVADDLLEAAALARDAGRVGLLAAAAYWYLGPAGVLADLSDPNFRPLLEEARDALDACPDDQFVRERMWVLGKLAHAHTLDADPTEQLALTEAALALSRRLDEPADRWRAVVWRLYAIDSLGRYDEWEALIEECTTLADAFPVTFQRDPLSWQIQAARSRGDVDRAAGLVDRYRRLFVPLGLALPGIVHGVGSARAIDQGRFAEARRLLDAWRDESPPHDGTMLGIGANEAWHDLWTIDADRYRATLEAMPGSAAAVLAVYPLASILALLEGDEEAARARYDEWRPSIDGVPAYFAFHMAATATYPTWRLGEAAVAERLVAGLAPHAGRWPSLSAANTIGPADLHLGVNRVTLGDLPAAEADLRAALASCEATTSHAWEAVALLHLADAVAQQGRADESAALAARCRAQAVRLGLTLVTQDLDRLGLTPRA